MTSPALPEPPANSPQSIYDIWDAKKAGQPRINFYDAWAAKKASSAAPAAVRSAEPADESRLVKYAQTTLERRAAELPQTPVGSGRNAALNDAGLRCYRVHLAAGLDLQEVTDVLGAADGGLNYPATRRTLQSAREAAERLGPAEINLSDRPTTLDPFDDGYAFAAPNGSVVLSAPGESDDLTSIIQTQPINWHDLWADTSTDEWIIEPLLPARRSVTVYSAPKVGKSLLLLEVAAAVTRGRRVLGYMPDRPRRVLYIDFENDPRGDVRSRLQAMHVEPGDLDGLIYLSYPDLAALDTNRGGQQLAALAELYLCEVVVIDTMSRSVEGPENENDTWLRFYSRTGLRLKQLGIALIRLDHSGKDEQKGTRGGSAKSGDVDAVWQLTRINVDTLRLECTASRMMINPLERTLILHRRSDPLRHDVDARGVVAEFDTEVMDRVRALDEAGHGHALGRDRIRTALVEIWGSSRAPGSNTLLARVATIRQARGAQTCPPDDGQVDPATPVRDVDGQVSDRLAA